MRYLVKIDGNSCECYVTEEDICFTSRSNSISVEIKLEDIIGFEVVKPYYIFGQHSLYLWYIQEQEDRKLTRASINISGDDGDEGCKELRNDVEEKIKNLSKRPKSLLVLINPIGGNKTALKDHKNIVEPVLKMAGIKCDVIISERPKQMKDVVTEYDFDGTDGVVVLGGDGSFSEIVSVLLQREQEKEGIDGNDPEAKIPASTIPVGLVPTGSGNSIVGNTTGFKDVLNSSLHIIKGNIYHMNMIGTYADDKLLNYAGIAVSYGSFTDLIYHSDNTYRWLGRLRYFVVPIWLSFVRPFIRTFDVEATCYGNVTETENSREQKAGEIEVMLEGKKVTGVKSYTKDSVVIEGKFSTIGSINGNVYDAVNKKYVWNREQEMPGHVFSAHFFHEDMTELQVFRHMKGVLQRKPERDVSFYDIVNCRGVRVHIKEHGDRDESITSMLNNLVLTDGEMHRIEKLDIQFRLHEKIVPLYTSYM